MSRKNKNNSSSEKEELEKQKNKSNKKDEQKKRLQPETLHSIWGLVCLAFGILLALAGFHQAGVAGDSTFSFLTKLFGWGYALLPITLLGAGLLLLLHKDVRDVFGRVAWGSLLFCLSGLGLIDVLVEGKGGFFGHVIGYIKTWIGDFAAGIFLIITCVIGAVIAADKPLPVQKLHNKLFAPKGAPQEKPEKTFEEKIVPEPIPQKEEKKEQQKEEEKEEQNEKESEGIFPTFSFKKQAVQKNIPDYKAPPFDLLTVSVEKPNSGDIKANSNIIHRTLESFGIPVEMGETHVGPKVTRFTLRPAEGVKLSRITALNQDLALALAAHPIRIEAPIPGKPFVGIEVPNKTAAVVRLGNLIRHEDFATSGQLGFCIGRDVTGDPIFANVEKMPHLLIAGATGSGKSITLHSVLISLLYRNSPKTLKLILIDPKRVELSAYNNLPHLVAPVVTQGKKALGVFKYAIKEMDERYEFFMKEGVRDIQSYNKKHPENPMSYLVIVVDEMADLMAAFGRDVENAIVRLAQMARAVGIHLILSTQRPSVEVITGLIKANITTRIALQVASQIDSRTILDAAGAEKLLGGGDLLFVSAQLSKPKRIQGAYITEDEIKAVTDYIKENNQDLMSDEVALDDRARGEGGEENALVSTENRMFETGKDPFSEFESDEEEDDMLQDAIDVVKQTQKASATLLQRHLKVGYARAARLLDIMENKGLVGPGNGAKPREIYMELEDDTIPSSNETNQEE